MIFAKNCFYLHFFYILSLLVEVWLLYPFALASDYENLSDSAKNIRMEEKITQHHTSQVNHTKTSFKQSESIFIQDDSAFFEAQEEIKKNTWYTFENNVHYLLLEVNYAQIHSTQTNAHVSTPIKEGIEQEKIIQEEEKRQDTVKQGTTKHDPAKQALEPANAAEESVANQETTTQSSVSQISHIEVLKFNPQKFAFNIYTASEQGKKAKTMPAWHDQLNLLSAINASMFLPDNLTSNGYLRCTTHINNSRIASKLGGFFITQPKDNASKSLPSAAIIYKDETDFSRFTTNKDATYLEILDMYDVVVQNFKLLEKEDTTRTDTKEETEKWTSNRRHSIAAIAEDTDGNILFLFSQKPIAIKDLVKTIRQNPLLNLSHALYLDGGKHAGMTLSTKDNTQSWFSNDNILLMLLGQTPIPNIIGVKKK